MTLPTVSSIIPHEYLATIQIALNEDIGSGDATTETTIPPEAQMQGKLIAKQAGIIGGLQVACAAFQLLDESVVFHSLVSDGTWVERNTLVSIVTGAARSLLTAERVALNFVGRISGIATLTNQFVRAVEGTKAIILDTRKTAPGLRYFDKLGVRCGGGKNHRFGLFDMVMIKDNHIDFSGSLEKAVELARSKTSLEIEVEARSLKDVKVALALGINRIMLDNMTVEAMREAVVLNNQKAKLEASGNITLDNVRQVAETGVDYISIGALTHSPKVFDVSFKYLK